MESPLFYPADIVRIVRLEAEERDVDGSADPPPQPRVGETGTVVEQVDDGIYQEAWAANGLNISRRLSLSECDTRL